MVFTTLEIVLGIVITAEDIKTYLEIDDDELGDCDLEEQLDLDKNMQLFKFPCCSDSANKLFIIGYSKHKYYRKHIRCNNCPGQRQVCDNCIGETNNGYYDVDTILNGPIEVNIRNICLNCYADNKCDMKLRHETVPTKNGQFFVDEDAEKVIGLKCMTCNIAIDSYRCPLDHLKFHDYKYDKLVKFCKSNSFVKDDAEIKLYYTINDCLSCT